VREFFLSFSFLLFFLTLFFLFFFSLPSKPLSLSSSLKTINNKRQKNRWVKRGIAAVPTMFGISFTHKTYNQAGAQVSIFAADGSVLVSHGGVEMGQGLHTKVAAVAAAALGVLREGEEEEEKEAKICPLPLSAVRVAAATRTDAVPNASPTAASASSDLYGGAVADACRQLMGRLRPYLLKAAAEAASSAATAAAAAAAATTTVEENKKPRPAAPPSASTFPVWKAAVAAAYAERVDLCAHGFYSTPGLGGWGSGAPFAYCSFGAAAVEAEVDCLTGDSSVVRADVCMDVGKSLNPAIDVGQVEGAFVQGLGWATTEEVVKCDASHPWVGRGNGRGRGTSATAAAAAAARAQTSPPSPPPSLPPLDGSTHTRGPGTYKIPSAGDVPADFRVSLLVGSRNAATAKTVHSSKAVGEPPFFLGAAAFFALKRAVGAAREDALAEGRGAEGGKEAPSPSSSTPTSSSYFRLDLPATSEALRLTSSGIDDSDDGGNEHASEALDAVARAAGVKGGRSRVSC
jgi:xanthine dehydrogenase/oxidase